MSADRELEVYATFVHGAVAVGNGLGLLWNLKRRNWKWVAIHGAGIVAHMIAARNHVLEMRRR